MALDSKMKMTEMGLIPTDWDISPIGGEFTFLRNNSFSREQLNYTEGSIKNVHYGDILVEFGEIVDVTKERLPFINKDVSVVLSPKNQLQDGDIIIADTAEDETAGKACEIQVLRGQQVISGLHTMPLRSTNRTFAPGFLGFAFNSALYHEQLLSIMQGTKVVSVSKRAIQDTFLVFPSYKEEQERIAKVLQDVTILISDLEKAINKKRLIKQGSIQRLITGSIRLKSFDDCWVEKTIGEIGHTYSGITGKGKSDFGHGKSRYITFLNVLNNPYIDTSILELVDINPLQENQNEVRKGDLFFNTSSETPEDVGTCSTLLTDVENAYLNSFCFGYRLEDEEMSGLFLSYYFRSAIGRKEMTMLAQGATRYNLSKENFNKIVVTVPPTKKEQDRIASILTAMDKEIAALEAERDKYKNIKQGMMQKLLTGQIRLPV